MHQHVTPDRRRGARVGPLMDFGVTVGEGQDAAALMPAGRVVEKTVHIVRHVNHERRKADAVGMDVLKGKQISG